MVLGITGLLGLFKEAGLSTATVQRETITQEQVSNLFWINVALGGVVCLLSIAMAPLIAWFYRDSRLTGIMTVQSFTFLLSGSTVQHQALLSRQMRFQAIAAIDVVSMLVSILVGCGLAAFGFGYWSLIGMQLSLAATGLVLTWWTSGWRPLMPRRHSGVGHMLSFGAHLTAADLVGRLAANSDLILVGRFFGPGPLGLYSRANVLLARPLEQLLTPLSAVMTPVLSRLQSDPERYRRTFLRAYDALALITFPFAALCLALAEPLVLLLLGPQWKGAVPLFAGFTLVAVSLPLSTAPSWLFMSQGRGRGLFHMYLIAGAVTVRCLFSRVAMGPSGSRFGDCGHEFSNPYADCLPPGGPARSGAFSRSLEKLFVPSALLGSRLCGSKPGAYPGRGCRASCAIAGVRAVWAGRRSRSHPRAQAPSNQCIIYMERSQKFAGRNSANSMTYSTTYPKRTKIAFFRCLWSAKHRERMHAAGNARPCPTASARRGCLQHMLRTSRHLPTTQTCRGSNYFGLLQKRQGRPLRTKKEQGHKVAPDALSQTTF